MNKKKLGFKWFGSLTNLSSSKDCLKEAKQREECCGGGSASLAGYASNRGRSGDIYSHVGTEPRGDRRKSCRGLRKTRRTSKREEGEREEASEGQSQWEAGDRVTDSPLLSVLLSLSSASLDQLLPKSAPASPALRRPPPLTPVPKGCWNRSPRNAVPERRGETLQSRWPNMATTGRQVAPSQDVYVPMEPVVGPTDLKKEGKQQDVTSAKETAIPAQEVMRDDSHRRQSDISGEYVKFSKEKFWLEPPTEEQVKQVEEELKLNGTDLRSQAWYHGHIPWEVSETLVLSQGDFLVRQSQSSPGDFVLTCRWDQRSLHFLIRKTAIQAGETYTQVQYAVEGQGFDTIPALVHFYVGSRAVVTKHSGVQILQPVNRTLPLSYLETAFCPRLCQRDEKEKIAGVRPRSPSSLHHQDAHGNQEKKVQTQVQSPEESTPCSPNGTPNSESRSTQTATRAPSPPSPTPSVNSRSRPLVDQDPPTLDADRGCYTELYLEPQSYTERLKSEDGLTGTDQRRREEDTNVYVSPVMEMTSFNPTMYQSKLMPERNKPLEASILRRVKELLSEIDPKVAAQHITKADCKVARILDVSPEVEQMMGVSSGMELLTLPHGQQLRRDLLERFHTMATMLAVDLLGCTGTNEERACLFHKMILIAAELKSNMGNMFGFAAVMRALELPQVGVPAGADLGRITAATHRERYSLREDPETIYEAPG
ncbi:SH2 domain containing 3Cb isoform X3 [Cynoglossus semilaevis]|uniref:SH2 domain containing 3Cb isoform X3 n=1 Tax=Cynoglossus semilaevis TaxID=244447 RepID=UPI000D627258|nr:SH2 domain-containing protein 3C isoform X3 [Cynoglossus semilaevis]